MTTAYIPTNELTKRIVSAVVQLRSKKPRTAILFTEHDGYPDGGISPVCYKEYSEANKALDEMGKIL